jgi:hypothetical protein
MSVTAVSATDAWAVGSYQIASRRTRTLVLHWDGTRWRQTPSPNPGVSSGLAAVSAVSRSDAWAVGAYLSSTGGVSKTLVLHWNGRRWTVAASPNPGRAASNGLQGVSALSSRDAWAVGVSSDRTGMRNLALHWNGTTWRQATIPTPGFGAAFAAVSAVSRSDAWAAGVFSPTPGAFRQTTLLLHWNGSHWVRS